MTARRSISKRRVGAAEAHGLYSVCLIGWEGPRPTFFGDNLGSWPCRVVTARKEETAADRSDLESPHVGIVVLERVWVPSEVHAKRLKIAIDEVLMGEQEYKMNAGLRHNWKNLRECWDETDREDRARWWAVVLEEAQRLVRLGAREFRIYDEDDMDRIAKARR